MPAFGRRRRHAQRTRHRQFVDSRSGSGCRGANVQPARGADPVRGLRRLPSPGRSGAHVAHFVPGDPTVGPVHQEQGAQWRDAAVARRSGGWPFHQRAAFDRRRARHHRPLGRRRSPRRGPRSASTGAVVRRRVADRHAGPRGRDADHVRGAGGGRSRLSVLQRADRPHGRSVGEGDRSQTRGPGCGAPYSGVRSEPERRAPSVGLSADSGRGAP